MKNSIIRIAAAIAAATAMFSCTKEPVAEQITPQETVRKCKIDIRLSDVRTRAVDVDSDDEAKLNNMQIFIFDSDNNIETYVSASDNDDLKDICVTAGAKHIHAVANMDPIDGIMTVSDLTGTISLLEENGIDCFVMSGSKDVTIDDDETVTIEVYRLVSRLDILKITTDFSASSLAGQTFEVDSIYVTNVVNECALSRSFISGRTYEYINKRGFHTSGADALLMDGGCGISLDGNDSQTLSNSYYVYPNNSYDDVSTVQWSPRLTRLVIVASLGGKKMYYPINVTIDEPNKKYVIEELTITRPGTDDPDQPVSVYECNFSLKVMPWASTKTWKEQI